MQPERFGRYKIISELGRGAMGQVYLAHDPEIDREVAVKTVKVFAALPEHERAEARERFLREARSAGRLLHPGIVTVFDVGEADGALYLAMEYVKGETLDQYCHPDRLLPVPRVVEIVARAADALYYAHDTDIVHRDIKSANLMRVGESGVKITDFGLAKPSGAQLTQDGALLGTPSYMSPEQIRGEQLDGRSDLFSLGVVLFELLTGERPFPGDSISSIIYRIVNEDPRDALEFSDRVPAALGRFLQRAMAKERSERFADGNEFARELRRAGAEAAGAETTAASQVSGASDGLPEQVAIPPAERTRPARSSVIPWVVVIVLLLGGVGAAGWYFREALGLVTAGPPPVTWLEVQVRVEPEEARLEVDGEPLDPQLAGRVSFRADQPPVRIAAEHLCRRVERELTPADAGSEVVLVLDAPRLPWQLGPELEGAAVQVNGQPIGNAIRDLDLDLCVANTVQIEAEGFRPVTLEIPVEATPLDARKLLASIELVEIPRGVLVLPESRTALVFYVDGERVQKGQAEVELLEGEHTLRAKNETLWIDVRFPVSVAGGERVTPQLPLPRLATLVVRAFPSNCKVYLRKPGGPWKYVDETPVERPIAAGKYGVRVELKPTGEVRDQEVELVAGKNPPIQVAFGRDS